MKSSIKTCLVKPKRTISLTKSTICIAVTVILAFTANLSAGPTLTKVVTLTGDTVEGGSGLLSGPLFVTWGVTGSGYITFAGEFKFGSSDPEFTTAGADANTFNISAPGSQSATLSFDFDVASIEFIYGGNGGDIDVSAFDEYGGLVDFYYDPNTNTLGGPAGPITLSGSGIRSLYWEDIQSSRGYAALDNIKVFVVNTVIPSPSAIVLGGIGVSFVCWLRKRKIV